jgi:hypothetical protein
MNPTQKKALTQLIKWAFSGGFYSYDDVSKQIAILEGASKWGGRYAFIQKETDDGISAESIKSYLLEAAIYQAYNV